MGFSVNKKTIENNIPDQIMEKVSSFPSMPRAGVKLRALLAEKDVSLDEIEDILRHDPDVVMVGEIRDLETGEISECRVE